MQSIHQRLEFQKLLQDGVTLTQTFPIEIFISRTEGLKLGFLSSPPTNLTSSNLTSNAAMPAMPTTTFPPRHVTPPPPRNGATLRGHGSDAKNSACLMQALSKVVPKTAIHQSSESLFVHQCFLKMLCGFSALDWFLFHTVVHSNKSSSPDRVIGGAPLRRPSQLISPATAQFLHRLEAIPSRALPEIIHFGQGPQATLETKQVDGTGTNGDCKLEGIRRIPVSDRLLVPLARWSTAQK